MIRATLILATALLVGCGTTTGEKPPTLYTLRQAAPIERTKARHDVEIIVRRLEIVDLYAQPEVVYRVGPHARRVHAKRRWIAYPAEMMSAVLADRLERTGLARSVVRVVGEELPHYELTGTVEALEEVRGEPPAARVALTLRLICLLTERVLWEQRFDAERPIPEGDSAPDVMSAIFVDQIDEAARRISRTMAHEKKGLQSVR